MDHRAWVPLGWWNDELRARQMPGGPVTGRDEQGRAVVEGHGWISRNDVFVLAAPATNDGDWEAVFALVWHAFAWGSGTQRRLMASRLDSLAADPASSAQLLRVALRQATTDPTGAYETLRPRGTAIRYIGPAFFTKLLYFAGGGQFAHPSLILDDRVAASLRALGWRSLRPGPWPAATYERYCTLLQRWATEMSVQRPIGADEVERWLFERR